jgi:Ca-activated chloride channel family protein
MDRDFVLEVPQANVPKRALIARDGDEWVVLASAVLPGVPESDSRALALTVLLDCSGSMAGESIGAARRAVGRVLESLDPRDRIGLLRFGSTHQWETEGLVPASRDHVARLRTLVRGIDADLGGTEMRAALEEAVRAPVPTGLDGRPMSADVLMITDGQVHELERIAGRIAKSGRRLFVVAVGSAPNEALARRLSEVTGGACEFVASGELAEDAILRMFRRMRAQPRTVSGVEWPGRPAWVLPWPRSVFPDETVHLIAGLRAAPRGAVKIAIGAVIDSSDAPSGVTDGPARPAPEVLEVDLAATLPPDRVLTTLVRVAAARRVAQLAGDGSTAEATALAVRHGLATSLTSFVVVAERAEADKVRVLPATVAVPHALPAGLVGVSEALVDISMSKRLFAAPASSRSHPPIVHASRSAGDFESLTHAAAVPPGRTLDRLAARQIVATWMRDRPSLVSGLDLADAGVDVGVVAALLEIAQRFALEEGAVLRVFLEILLEVAEASAEGAKIVLGLATAGPSAFTGREGRELRRAIRDAAF